MAQTLRAKIGLVTPTSPSGPHFESFGKLIPSDVRLEIEGLDVLGNSIYELKALTTPIVKLILDRAKTRSWDGVMVSAAPVELLNPDLRTQLDAAVPIPATTALSACVAALQAFSAKRILLLTPFDDPMNQMIKDFLARAGIGATPIQTFRHYTEAIGFRPEEVYRLAQKSLAAASGIEAIYFQGAVLDPLPVIDRIEKDLGVPVVASNPAMLWHILSKLGLRYQIRGYGRLLAEWRQPPA
ncbi:MAG: hypothetical protein HYT78_03490 [Deltaproteobacteria bacterium]|nr:hypothetical protein [Deltaproteobacteria bacterium]